MKAKFIGWFKHCIAGICLSCIFIIIYIADICSNGVLFRAMCSHMWAQASGFWRFVTFGLLHESLLHLAVNVAGLICVCSLVEREIGAWRTLLIWLFGSVCGELAFSFCATFEAGCGASVGIFALAAALCAMCLRYPKRVAFKWYRFDLVVFVIYLIAANANSLAAVEHAFGFVFGMILSVGLLLLGKFVKPHEMRLQPDPFEKIKSGRKKVEMRLNDEKRRRIAVGDRILFTNASNGEKLNIVVAGVYPFPSFHELYAAFPPESLGYGEGEYPDPADMEKYYDNEMIKQYGVLGIAVDVK